MKKILILIPFLVLGWAGSTWFVGNETEALLKTYLQNSKKAYAEMGVKSNFEIKDYKKSFFKSTAATIFSINTGDPIIDAMLKDIRFNNTITHGPLLFVNGKLSFGTAYIHSTLDMEAVETETKELIKEIFADKNPLSSNIIFGFNETADYEIIVPAIKIKEDISELVVKDGIHLSGTVNKNTLTGIMKGTIGEIKINDEGLIINTETASIEVDMQGMVAGQMLGSSHFVTPSVKIEGESIPIISFGVELSTNTHKVDNNALDGNIKLSASNIQAPIDISTINFNTSFKGFQIKGLEQLISIQEDLEQLQSDAFNAEMSEEEQEALLIKIQNLPNVMVAAIQNILKKDKTALSIKMDIASKQGNAVLDIESHYIGNGADINLEELTENGLAALLKIITGKIDFNTPKAMLASTPAAFFMPSLMEQGVIAEDKDNYRLNAIFKTDAIVLNNKSMSVDEFGTLLVALGLGELDGELPEGVDLPENIETPEIPSELQNELSPLTEQEKEE